MPGDDRKTREQLLEELAAARRAIVDLRTAADNSSDLVVRYDRKYRYSYANRAALEASGHLASQLIGKSNREMGHPEHLCELLEASIAKVLETGQPTTIEFETELPKGSSHLNLKLDPEFDEEGRVSSVLGVSRDVTERKQIEEALRAARESLEAAIAQSPSGILIADAPGVTIRAANQAAFGIRGGNPRVLTEIDVAQHSERWQIFRPDGSPYPSEQLPLSRAVLHGEVTRGQDAIIRDQEGNDRWVSVNAAPIRDSKGEITAGIVVFHEITERKLAEERLSKTARLLTDVLNLVPDMIFAKDLELRTMLCNEAFASAVGKTAEEMIGHTDVENGWDPKLVHGCQDEGVIGFETSDRRVLDGESVHDPCDPANVGGEIRFFDTHKLPMRDAEGRIIGLLGVARDVTDRNRAELQRLELEAQLQQAQKLESLGILASGIAHDFNNLLVGIYSNMDLALLESEEDSPIRTCLTEARTAAGRASDLISQMLAYAGKGTASIEEIALGELVQEMAALLKTSVVKTATISLDLAEDLPAMRGDPTQVRQIVMNLITNAAQSIGEDSGEITVKTEQVQCDRALLDEIRPDTELPMGCYLRLSISDTGSGIDEEIEQQIFDPFFTTKAEGSGLGLSAVHGIVHRHGGGIGVISEPGRGASFSVFFPAVVQPASTADATSAPVDWHPSGTILVVDDEELVRSLAVRAVERFGFTALSASDGLDAIKVFREHCDEIDCILLDLRMPHMDGEETFDALRRIRNDVPVILCSGLAEEASTKELMRRGLSAFLKKPYSIGGLREKLRDVMEAE